MLVSDTSALESTMRSGELERQFRRLSLYVDRLGNINMQATLIAGFAFSATTPEVLDSIMDNLGPLSTIYIVLIFIAIALSCWVVTVSLNVQIKAEKLAMEGPDGSVRYALAAIIKVSDLIAQLHSCAAACLGGAMLATIWNYLNPAVAAILTVMILLLFWHAYQYNQELDELFSLEGKRLVGRGEHLQRALLVAAKEEEERESKGTRSKRSSVQEPLIGKLATRVRFTGLPMPEEAKAEALEPRDTPSLRASWWPGGGARSVRAVNGSARPSRGRALPAVPGIVERSSASNNGSVSGVSVDAEDADDAN
ncbi:hypothetical protein T492DRAFT_950383 [Pavlovales sp. CCMP2436]|nr:hypothetical protein T492DRAFT_950383 [Pavlovales sp. CCMP2436]|mmetsp:Transcript_29570/g.74339  ORF Transcript_29570/g.74339 Transcript_29570/m.74339 type:complete len:310 (+) Transcript_29570:125-1054(+)